MLDSEGGRWTRRDPLGYADGINLFQYVQSVPIIYTDPSGTLGCREAATACLGAGLAQFQQIVLGPPCAALGVLLRTPLAACAAHPCGLAALLGIDIVELPLLYARCNPKAAAAAGARAVVLVAGGTAVSTMKGDTDERLQGCILACTNPLNADLADCRLTYSIQVGLCHAAHEDDPLRLQRCLNVADRNMISCGAEAMANFAACVKHCMD